MSIVFQSKEVLVIEPCTSMRQMAYPGPPLLQILRAVGHVVQDVCDRSARLLDRENVRQMMQISYGNVKHSSRPHQMGRLYPP